jgi:hypothetical protein
MQAADRLEPAADASAIEPSTCKQEDKAYVQLHPYDKETSRTREYNSSSTKKALGEYPKELFPNKNNRPN